MPTLTQLEYALAVEKHRHFGQASEACHVSQPTLSQQLQKLEEEIEIILFDRLKKPILPTPEGKRFLDQARVVLREHQKLLHVSKQTKSGDVAGEFRLAVIPTVASHLLPLFLQKFSKEHPQVDLYIEELKTEVILSELQGDRLDGAILATPIEGAHLKIHPLYYEPFQLYLSSGHPLLKKSRLDRGDLDAQEMWQLQDGHCFKNQVYQFCSFPPEKNTVLTNVHFESGSLDTLKRLVQTHRGYTMLPAMMADSLRADEAKNHVRSFKAPVPVREISFVYRRDHWKLGIIDALEKSIADSLPEVVTRKKTEQQVLLEVC